MSYKNILVPYDESDHAKNALIEAMKLADEETVIHVIEVSAPPQDLVYTSMNQTSFGIGMVAPQENFAELVQKRTEEATEDLKKDVADVVIDGFKGTIEAEVIYGIYTVETIIDTAKDMECDLIAMGCRGLGAIRGALGSVSYAVLRNAEIPVLVCK